MNTDTCPLCGKQLLNPNGLQQANKRICSLCGLSIRRNHKWTIGSDAKIRHRDCSNPTGKTNTEESKGIF